MLPSAQIQVASTQPTFVAQTFRALTAAPSEAWRAAAVALLSVSTKECEALGAVFEDVTVSDESRLFVLDLLASAGTFEAQVVMRRLLALAIARRESRMFASFVQRLGFCVCPDGPTLRFLMNVYAESRAQAHEVRAACAYALGAAVGHAYAARGRDAAIRASEVLRRDLRAARSPQEKCALLTALGNAALPGDAAALLRLTEDPNAQVRAAAARSLRKIATPQAHARLVAMLADREPFVAESALVGLAAHDALGTMARPQMVENNLRVILARMGNAQPARAVSGERAAVPAEPVRAASAERTAISAGNAEAAPETERQAPPVGARATNGGLRDLRERVPCESQGQARKGKTRMLGVNPAKTLLVNPLAIGRRAI